MKLSKKQKNTKQKNTKQKNTKQKKRTSHKQRSKRRNNKQKNGNGVRVVYKNMKGGASLISGYVEMLDFLNNFKENLNTKTPINIISFIDNENSSDPEQIGELVLYKWIRPDVFTLQTSQNQNMKVQTVDNVTIYSDFDDFAKAVTNFLKTVENDLSSPEKEFLDVKRQKLYFLVTQRDYGDQIMYQ